MWWLQASWITKLASCMSVCVLLKVGSLGAGAVLLEGGADSQYGYVVQPREHWGWSWPTEGRDQTLPPLSAWPWDIWCWYQTLGGQGWFPVANGLEGGLHNGTCHHQCYCSRTSSQTWQPPTSMSLGESQLSPSSSGGSSRYTGGPDLGYFHYCLCAVTQSM